MPVTGGGGAYTEAIVRIPYLELPNTEAATRDSLSWPPYAGLTDEAQDYVIDCLATHVAA
jgi:dTDP-4-amino-4,6-dideoxygalactose transaminase